MSSLRSVERSVAVSVLAVALSCAAGLTFAGGAAAAQVDAVAGEEVAPLADLDVGQLEAFFDGWVGAYLEETGTVGGVVAVVQDGELIFAKGYGEADRSAHRDVDAGETLFRVGSVSKLFVWTAVMQLVEQGRIDLDTDVNEYLDDLEVPATFDEPVTMAHLMSHTAGFEDRPLGLFSHTADSLAPLVEILAADLPQRVRPPGEVSSYSNHGTALAMHVVERVAGVPWQRYVEEHILAPLGMHDTTFTQPPPGELEARLSRGYRIGRGREPVEEGFEYIPLAAVGAMSTTAEDMARFMVAHLHYGSYGGGRILEEETARSMQSPLFRHADAVNPMAHGFIDSSRNGQRIVGHGGDTLWFHTQLELFPDQDLGLFASFNTAGAQPAKLAEAFTDRFFPVPDPPELEPPPTAAATNARLVGSYRSNRFSHSDLTKLAALMGTIEVTSTPDGALETSLTGETRWIEESPLVFREEDGQRRIAFRAAADGRIAYLFVSDIPVIAFERVPPRENPRLHLILASTALLLLTGTLVVLPLGAFLRWRYRAPVERDRRIPAGAGATLWLLSLLFVLFALGLLGSMSNPMDIVFGVTTGLRLVLVLPLLGAVVGLIALAFAVRAWREQQGRLLSRLAYTAVVLSCFVLLWQLAIWQLLGEP